MASSLSPPPPPPYSLGEVHAEESERADGVPQLVGPAAGAGLLGVVVVAELRRDPADRVPQHRVFGRFREVHDLASRPRAHAGGRNCDLSITYAGARADVERRSQQPGVRGEPPGAPGPARRPRGAGGARTRWWRAPLRRPPPGRGEAHGARARRAAARPRRAVPRALAARRVGHRLPRGRQHRHRRRRGLGRRVRGHRPRPDGQGRHDEPVTAEEEPAGASRSPGPTACRSSTWSSRAAPTCPPRPTCSCPPGSIFHDLTQLSGLGIPTVALVFGNSTAGGAYVPGMCDYSGARRPAGPRCSSAGRRW